MSVFTAAEIDYLQSQRLGRVATVGPDGQPHVAPVTYLFNTDEDAIDLGGIAFGDTKKWRDAQQNPRVTFLVDDVIPEPRTARAVEIRSSAELHGEGGESIRPTVPQLRTAVHAAAPTPHRQLGAGESGGRQRLRTELT